MEPSPLAPIRVHTAPLARIGLVSGRGIPAIALILALCLPHASTAQPAGRRVALVVGNGAYAKLGKLKNPANDAQDMGSSLKKLGFEVEILADGGLGAMMEAVERFGQRLSGAEAGFFFYAGHGVQSSGINYLLPSDADVQGEFQLKYKALPADLVLETMNASGCALNIVVLDACRDNPFASFRSASRGLAVLGAAPAGAIIVYATDPGKTAADGSGRNGAFTEALLRHIATPGLDVKELFDRVGAEVAKATKQVQTPWVSSKYYGSYYLAGAAPPSPPIAAPASPSPAPSPAASAAAKAQPQGKAELLVTTVPEGAELFIGETRLGKAGDVLSIPAGAELVVRAKQGYLVGSAKLLPANGKLYDIKIKLEAQKGNLLFKAPGAEGGRVFLDGKDLGAFGKGLFRDLAAGEHEYAIRGKGFSASGRVLVAPEATTTVAAVLVEVGSLRLSMPPECSARVSGAGFGPLELGPGGFLEDVPAGEVRVEASGPGYDEAAATLTIRRASETAWKPWTTGGLAIRTDPPGAAVTVNGKRAGKAPVAVRELAVGKATVQAEAEGYEGASLAAAVSLGKTVPLELKLERSVGSFRAAVGADAVVTIRGADFGPRSLSGPASLQGLPTGEYRVEAGGPGYEPASGTVLVRRGAETVWTPWTTGSLLVETDPPGALVLAGGKEAGRAPVTLSALPAGATVSLLARAEGREEASLSSAVVGGKTATLRIALPRSLGRLAVVAPADAAVTVRGAEIGERRAAGAEASFELPTGEYRLEASCPGLAPAQGTILVKRGATATWTPWTKGYLSLESSPPEATVLVDGVERGRTPLLLELEAKKPHKVQLLLAKHESYAADLSVAIGQKLAVSRELRGLPASISVETNPPGARVRLYGTDKEGVTPCVLEGVEPGELTVSILSLEKDKRFYKAEDVRLVAGLDERISVNRTLVLGKSKLSLRNVPSGAELYLDGARVDKPEAFASGIELDAGLYQVGVTAPGELEWRFDIGLLDGLPSVANLWDRGLVLPRRTIKVDGETADWDGIAPIFKPDSNVDRLPETSGTLISSGFVCRDEKNLYWRMDFSDGKPDPFLKILSHALRISSPPYEVQLSVRNHSPREAFLGFYKMGWDGNARIGSYAVGQNVMEMRIPYSAFEKYCQMGTPLLLRMTTYRYVEGDDSSFMKTSCVTNQMRVWLGE